MTESSATRTREMWKRLLSAAVSQTVDPAPIHFLDDDFRRGRFLVKTWRQATGERLQLQRSIPRKAFLAACLELTADEDREHLIIGFGIRRNNSTFVAQMARRLGNAGSVPFPPELQKEVAEYVRSGHRNEVLVFHNHPANFINAVCDNEPWASPQDREIAIRHAFDPAILVKQITNGGRTRFYLGENGFVREFIAPDMYSLLNGRRSPD